VGPWEGLVLDQTDRTPVYAQLERGIRSAIATGRLAVGDQLPTVRQLAVDLRVNANTVAKVYLALERDGVVETKRGVGTFILPPKQDSLHMPRRDLHLRTLAEKFLNDAEALGFSPRVVLQYLTQRIKEGE
jgi:GntR family transcriptional regulator